MTLRAALAHLVFAAFALCVLAIAPAAAHEGHGAHAPAASVKPLLDSRTMQAIKADVGAPQSGAVIAAFLPDDHDCAERGCYAGIGSAGCSSLIAPALAPALCRLPAGIVAAHDPPFRAGLSVPILGPPPKFFA